MLSPPPLLETTLRSLSPPQPGTNPLLVIPTSPRQRPPPPLPASLVSPEPKPSPPPPLLPSLLPPPSTECERALLRRLSPLSQFILRKRNGHGPKSVIKATRQSTRNEHA